MTTIEGKSLIGAHCVEGEEAQIFAINPADGSKLPPAFRGVSQAQLSRSCAVAWDAFDSFRDTSLTARATFLETVADNILGLGNALIERAQAETGLPSARLAGERGRTVGQLRLFARVVRNGLWLEPRIDHAQPERTPTARPDLRQRHIPLGPVVVFGASNFPLAFSVAGGDTASALAAGCPVIVKGHSAHLGTSELVGRAVQSAVAESGLPEGVFSLVFGAGREVGAALVSDPRIKAVGFTGSRAGGLALMNAAAARAQPIPVYAEMSSINPVLAMPSVLAARAAEIATDFLASLTSGAGQFCTNPGLLLAVDDDGLQSFVAAMRNCLADSRAATMLTPGIYRAYCSNVDKLRRRSGVELVGQGRAGGVNQAETHLFSVTADQLISDASLHEEVFGPSSLVVRCRSVGDMPRVIERLEGQLTVTVHMARADSGHVRSLLPALERKAGRILINGFPTGVEVSDAIVHGGPFPATSDGRSTSVGTLAIRRFLRPVCYQNFPPDLLPEGLGDANPLGLWRLVNGNLSKD